MGRKPYKNRGANSGGPYKQCIIKSLPVLDAIIDQAPNCYPALANLKHVMLKLDTEYNVFLNKETDSNPRGKKTATLAMEAAECWKKMCKDVLVLAASPTFSSASSELTELVERVRAHKRRSEETTGAKNATGADW